jgi:hypothetical protein
MTDGQGDPMDEDEELEALRVMNGTGAGGYNPTQAEVEVKVHYSPAAHRVAFVLNFVYFSQSQSTKCGECGKVFKNTALANCHTGQSGHNQFEESTK